MAADERGGRGSGWERGTIEGGRVAVVGRQKKNPADESRRERDERVSFFGVIGRTARSLRAVHCVREKIPFGPWEKKGSGL